MHTSSKTKKGEGLYELIVNSRAKAASVFSPPDSWPISRYRFLGGIVLKLMPHSNGGMSSPLSLSSRAVPPKSFGDVFVSSLYTLSMFSDTCTNTLSNICVRCSFTSENLSRARSYSLLASLSSCSNKNAVQAQRCTSIRGCQHACASGNVHTKQIERNHTTDGPEIRSGLDNIKSSLRAFHSLQ